MAAFSMSSFGLFVMSLFAGLLTPPSWQTFLLLVYGWAVARGSARRSPTYLWLSGATSVKHFSRFYAFLGAALYHTRWQLWARIIRRAAQWVPPGQAVVIAVDDSTKKKAGSRSKGSRHYRNGAGSARQEYHTLRGLNFVWGIMRVPLACWPGRGVSVPIGLSLYLKEDHARKLQLPYQSRSALAREIVDFVAAQLPTRPVRVLGDGGYATKDYLQKLPATVHVVGRMLITGKLYAPPPRRAGRAAGVPRRKARCWGRRKRWPANAAAGSPIPPKPGRWSKRGRGCGIPSCQAACSGSVVVRRPTPLRPRHSRRRKPCPPVEAFFTTALTLSVEAILAQYRDRWAVEITIRDSNAFTGFGQDQCRKHERVVGANTLRLLLAAARTLWFVEQTSHTAPCDFQHSRPWYRQKCAPSQLDIVWACREALQEAGVFPIPRFSPPLAINQQKPEIAFPLAA